MNISRSLMVGLMLGHMSVHGRGPRIADVPGGWTDTVALATITTDTGALAPGNKDFSRFTVPGECIGAVAIAGDLDHRSVADQVARLLRANTMRGDVQSPGAVAVARKCMTRFTVQGVLPAELPDLFTLSLMADQDSLAHAVLIRRMALASDTLARVSVLQDAVARYLDASPNRFAAAESAAARLDAMGTSVQVARMFVHRSLLQFARARFDEPAMSKEARQIIALGHEVPADDIRDHLIPLIDAYAALGQVAYVEHPDSVMVVMARAKADIGRFFQGANVPSGASANAMPRINYRTADLVTIRNALIPFNAERYAGKPLPPVPATYWIPRPPSLWPPRDGHPSLLIYGGALANECARSDGWLLMFNSVTDMTCGALYTYLPTWMQQYGNRLTITLVSQAEGRAARSVVLTPQEEADTLAWFFRDHLALPITVGVVVDSVWRLSPIDGREFSFDTTFYGRLLGPTQLSPLVVLYDTQGTLCYVGAWNVPVLRMLLARVMGAGGSRIPHQDGP